jgi:hypothetical protein
MKKLIAAVFVAFIAVIIFDYAFAVQGRPDKTKPIKCYQCNSFYDRGCSDFFDNRTYPLIPCFNNATMCRKIIQETFYDNHWEVRYIRQCGIYGEVGPAEGRWCFERRGQGELGVRVKVCHCDNKDGCNTGSSLVKNSTSVLTLFLLLSVGWLTLCSKLLPF